VQDDIDGTCTNFLHETDMWRLIGKNSKESKMLEKHNIKERFWEKKISKNMLFSIGMVSPLSILWSIWISIEPMEKQINSKLEQMKWNFKI
jgi:hypothetical protein